METIIAYFNGLILDPTQYRWELLSKVNWESLTQGFIAFTDSLFRAIFNLSA